MALLSPLLEIPPKIICKTNPRNVCASTKDCDVGVSALEEDPKFSRQFSAPVKRGSSLSSLQNKEEEEKQNYYVNTGYAIRTLREEFPELFYREPSFDIYRDDIVFKDPFNAFIGIENYKAIFWALRFHGKIFFKALWVDILSVWQPIDSVIMVRWTVQGIPRVPWESRGRFDGTSEYKLDKNGKIFEHRVDNIIPNSPTKFPVMAVEELIQVLGCPSTPKPTYFEISSSPPSTSCQVCQDEESSSFQH
uniref:NTF2-like domain-containing protein n=1 Tax=Nelumbo nucifera TaxID=4432 RepID=A0A822XJV4_NELNU|nr:TPA_asm: hypothetical protein HUJ06_020558 [Nelumbo nucifera]